MSANGLTIELHDAVRRLSQAANMELFHEDLKEFFPALIQQIASLLTNTGRLQGELSPYVSSELISPLTSLISQIISLSDVLVSMHIKTGNLWNTMLSIVGIGENNSEKLQGIVDATAEINDRVERITEDLEYIQRGRFTASSCLVGLALSFWEESGWAELPFVPMPEFIESLERLCGRKLSEAMHVSLRHVFALPPWTHVGIRYFEAFVRVIGPSGSPAKKQGQSVASGEAVMLAKHILRFITNTLVYKNDELKPWVFLPFSKGQAIELETALAGPDAFSISRHRPETGGTRSRPQPAGKDSEHSTVDKKYRPASKDDELANENEFAFDTTDNTNGLAYDNVAVVHIHSSGEQPNLMITARERDGTFKHFEIERKPQGFTVKPDGPFAFFNSPVTCEAIDDLIIELLPHIRFPEGSHKELMEIAMRGVSESRDGVIPAAIERQHTAGPGARAASTDGLRSYFGREQPQTSNGKKVSIDSLSGYKVGFLFVSSRDEDCIALVRHLVDVYNKLRRDKKPFEIVMIGVDETRNSMADLVSGKVLASGSRGSGSSGPLPWLHFPHPLIWDTRSSSKTHPVVTNLLGMFTVSEVPWLSIVAPTGQIAANKAVTQVCISGASAFDTWTPAPIKTPEGTLDHDGTAGSGRGGGGSGMGAGGASTSGGGASSGGGTGKHSKGSKGSNLGPPPSLRDERPATASNRESIDESVYNEHTTRAGESTMGGESTFGGDSSMDEESS
eukprot:comp21731_c0_seq1/m.48485 comp21731_c0_seq1/g.48485  ORF comp21731_c0_seq1/g.48485 comp21731_c0_seq1/m.48485 type:complete len:735 (-) comp21731_c0_seq1:44-2248(-)